MFITFEGIDGCGKSTQVRLLEEYLVNAGRRVMVLREPGATSLSEAIRSLLLSADFHIEPMSELLLFCAARRQLVETVIRPALKDGIIVICDRFLDSSTAYQGYGRGLDMYDVREANRLATSGLLPDITFFLDIRVEEAFERSARRKDGVPDRMERSGVEFYERVRDGYLRLALESKGRVVTIDGVMSISSIHMDIVRSILKHEASTK